MTQLDSIRTAQSPRRHEDEALVGALVDGRYRLSRLVGTGSSAAVFSAEDLNLNREVIVKVFDASIAADRSQRGRFEQQAGKAAHLTHPHIVAILDAGIWADEKNTEWPYVVMEPAGGGSVRDVLASRGRLTMRQAVSVAAQVADALEYAHRNGVLHADVKPENVLVDPRTGNAQLVDFSLSFVSTRTGLVTAETITRRAAYLAPEQVQGEPVTPSTDVYGLGVMLYEMVVGRPPFVGATPTQTAERRVHEHARPAGNFEPSIPAELDRVLERALARDPAQRWGSMAELRRELNGLLSASIQPRTVPDIPDTERVHPLPNGGRRTKRPHRLTPVLMSAAAIVAGMALVSGIVGLLGGSGRTFERVFAPGAPDVVGQTVEVAQSLAAARGFALDVIGERMSESVPRGHVIQQTPVAGWQPEQGIPFGNGTRPPLRVTVSAGVSVPDVRGKSLDEASAYLASVGWKVARVEQGSHPDHAPNSVVLQFPAPGETVSGPGEVLLAVAR